MIDDTITVRCSSLSSWPDCPRRGAARSFKRLIEAAGFKLRQPAGSIGASVGSAVHRGAETLLTEKAGGADSPNLSAAQDAAVETLHDRMREDDARMDKETPSQSVAERQVIRMTQAYAAHIVPDVEPLTVEQRLVARIPWSANNLALSGQSDVLAREPSRLRDLKTGKGRFGSHRPQFGGYSLLGRTHGFPIKEIAEDFVQRCAIDKPQPAPRTFAYDVQGCEQAAVSVIRHMDLSLHTFLNGDPARNIEPGDPASFPANPSSKLCSERWCSAWGTPFCREHDGGQEEADPRVMVPASLSAADRAKLMTPGSVVFVDGPADVQRLAPEGVPDFLA
jgi:hypothetical protein